MSIVSKDSPSSETKLENVEIMRQLSAMKNSINPDDKNDDKTNKVIDQMQAQIRKLYETEIQDKLKNSLRVPKFGGSSKNIDVSQSPGSPRKAMTLKAKIFGANSMSPGLPKGKDRRSTFATHFSNSTFANLVNQN